VCCRALPCVVCVCGVSQHVGAHLEGSFANEPWLFWGIVGLFWHHIGPFLGIVGLFEHHIGPFWGYYRALLTSHRAPLGYCRALLYVWVECSVE